MDEPAVADLVALAHERRVPVLIHAGRGIPALGELTVRLAERNPDAHLILAHAAISDLAWLWRVLPDHPNVLIDTAWWNPVDLVALFALAPPANIVWASDSPYGMPVFSAVMALRCALQAGVGPAALRGIAGESDRARARRGRAGRPRRAARPAGGGAGPAARARRQPPDRRLRADRGRRPTRPSRSGSRGSPAPSGADGPHAAVFAAVLEELDAFDRELAPPPPDQRFPAALRRVVHALIVARTPDVPLPALPAAPAPTREAAEH